MRKQDTAIKVRELAPAKYQSSPNIVQDYGRHTGQFGLATYGHQKH